MKIPEPKIDDLKVDLDAVYAEAVNTEINGDAPYERVFAKKVASALRCYESRLRRLLGGTPSRN